MQGLGTPHPYRTRLVVLLAGLACACSSSRHHRVAPMPDVVVTTNSATPTATPPLPSQDDPFDRNAEMRVLEKGDRSWRLPGQRELSDSSWNAQGLWVGAFGSLAGPGKNLDGSIALASPTDVSTPDIVYVPDLDSGSGFGGYVSYRWTRWEMMVAYEQTEHDGTFPGNAVTHDTTITNLDLNFRRYWGVDYAFQPFLLLGLGWTKADIENGTTDQATMTVVRDASLEDGININLGGGLAFYPLPWISVFGQAMWRITEYEATDGLAGKLDNGPTIEADGWNLSVGASIRLLRGR